MKKIIVCVLIVSVGSLLLLLGCQQSDNPNNIKVGGIEFEGNASTDEISGEIRYLVSQYDFCVIFFKRNDTDLDWYKIFAARGGNWEKIEMQQAIFNEEQLRSAPNYHIARDITTTKLCTPEESDFFLTQLKRYKLFELPEEDILFRSCRNTQIADFGFIYIQMVSGSKVRSLHYSEIYECENNEWVNIQNINKLFEDEWIPESLVGVELYNKNGFR